MSIRSNSIIHIVTSLTALLSLTACNLLEISPHDIEIDEDYRNLNSKNITDIGNLLTAAETDSFDFAVFSDTHADYDKLHQAVKWVNLHPEIKFTVHLGDMTEAGLKYEFGNTEEEMSRLKNPHIMVIGNHDYLSQGQRIYQKMYGPTNFSFTIGTLQFTAFDDVVWENGNRRPDFAWLSEQLTSSADNKILLMHIPETDEQMNSYRTDYETIINSVPDLYRLHGHTHHEDNAWPKLISGALRDGIIYVIRVRPGKITAIRETPISLLFTDGHEKDTGVSYTIGNDKVTNGTNAL